MLKPDINAREIDILKFGLGDENYPNTDKLACLKRPKSRLGKIYLRIGILCINQF